MPTLLLLLLAACGVDGDSAEETAAEAAPEAAVLRFTLANIAAPGSLATSAGPTEIALAPGLLVVHAPGAGPLVVGASAHGTGLEALGEDGDPTALLAELDARDDVRKVVVIATRSGDDYATAPIHPGEAASGSALVDPADEITVLSMFGQSNDVMVATASGGVVVFDAVGPVLGELPLALYDLGTERNQEPGAGADQAPRQAGANTGEAEDGVVSEVVGADSEGWTWPAAATFATLTVALD